MLIYVDGNCHVVLENPEFEDFNLIESTILDYMVFLVDIIQNMMHFLLAVETLLNLLKENHKKNIIHLIMLMARIHATYCVKDKARKGNNSINKS